MQLRSVCGWYVLALTGCFSDPPTGTGGGDGSTSAASSSSGTSAETSSSTTDDDESSTGFFGSSSGGSSSGDVCVVEPFDPGRVPADIVALVDEGLPTALVQAALDQFVEVAGNNVAILAPESELASLQLDADCSDGCGSCSGPMNRVVVPYTSGPYQALADFASFDCIFREPLPNTSGPAAHLWFITREPNQMPPPDLAAIVLEGEEPLRVHVACPGCDEDLFTANALLKEVVVASGGSVQNANSPVMVTAQAAYIRQPRYSCLWEPEGDPAFLAFEPTAELGEFFADPVDSRADCPTDTITAGDVGAFHPDDAGVRLCPETCQAVQAFPADFLDVFACE